MTKELFPLAEKIKQMREQSKMTQAGLARALGITRASINAWEIDRKSVV